MFRQLAKIARTPPSPKNRAWMISATLTAMTAAHGPRTIAISVPPTPWAVVPPGTGHVEHHDREAQRAEDREQRHRPVVEDVLDPAGRDRPGRHREDAQADGHDRAQIAIRDVHLASFLGFLGGARRAALSSVLRATPSIGSSALLRHFAIGARLASAGRFPEAPDSGRIRCRPTWLGSTFGALEVARMDMQRHADEIPVPSAVAEDKPPEAATRATPGLLAPARDRARHADRREARARPDRCRHGRRGDRAGREDPGPRHRGGGCPPHRRRRRRGERQRVVRGRDAPDPRGGRPSDRGPPSSGSSCRSPSTGR